MQADFVCVAVGLASFMVFFVIHVVAFRWLEPEKLLRSLKACVIVIAVLPVALTAVFWAMHAAVMSLPQWALAAVLALGISGLMSMVYVLCVFGPYETSVRMRIIREIGAHPQRGMSLPQLLERYNAQVILDIRLRRLIGSGDILKKEGVYICAAKRNFMFLSDIISGAIKKWIDG